MRMQLILAVTSPTAFLEVGEHLSIELALKNLASIGSADPFTIAIDQENSDSLSDFLRNSNFNVEILLCEPRDALSFAKALLPNRENFDAVLIHDASRPFVSKTEIEAVLAALDDETDAVRPAMAFTETLKVLDTNSVIKRTLDRSTVHRVSTPELIRVPAIDFAGGDCGWFLPLKKGARASYIEASPHGLRINTEEDRNLMEMHSN